MKYLTKQEKVGTVIISIFVLIGILFLFTLLEKYFPGNPEDWSVPGFY